MADGAAAAVPDASSSGVELKSQSETGFWDARDCGYGVPGISDAISIARYFALERDGFCMRDGVRVVSRRVELRALFVACAALRARRRGRWSGHGVRGRPVSSD